jgi:tetratricopeptide (TPR) repeat protein
VVSPNRMPPPRGLRRLLDKLSRSLTKRARGMEPARRADVFGRALRIRARRYGVSDWRTLETRIDYAFVRHRNGDSAAAEADLAELIARYGDSPPPADRMVLLARYYRATILFDLGRPDDAERMYRELTRDADRDLGRSDGLSLDAHENHAGVLQNLGYSEEAEAEVADVVALRTAALGPDAKDTVRARQSRAELLTHLGRLEESERAWRELADVYDRQKKQTDPNALRAQEKHAVAMYKLGRVHEAAAEFAQLADRLAATHGVNHPDTARVWAWRDDTIREAADTP